MEWDELLTAEASIFITKASHEEVKKIEGLFKVLKERVKDPNILVTLANNWYKFNSHEQAHVAVHHVGMYQASRFIILMDYLSFKIRGVKHD